MEFSIVCEECGKIWKSKAIVFSKACVHPVTEWKESGLTCGPLSTREKRGASEGFEGWRKIIQQMSDLS